MRQTNKRQTKKRQIKNRKRVSRVSRKRHGRAKNIFRLSEKTTEPNIMVKHTNTGGIISGLRAYLGKKSI